MILTGSRTLSMTQFKAQFDEIKNPAVEKLFWMNGLQEYLQHKQHPQLEIYNKIKKAIMYGNVYAMQELVMQEIRRGHINLSDEFVRVLFNQYSGYEQITHRKVLQYISHCIDDEYIRMISRWSIKFGSKALLNDHFSRGQMLSKLWMVDKLKDLFPANSIPTIAHYGGWYATVAQHLFQHYEIKNYWNIEKDVKCVGISEAFNDEQRNNNWQFKGVGVDVNDIYWKYRKTGEDVTPGDEYFIAGVQNAQKEYIEVEVTPDLIINTSCEHMDNQWFENIPKGKTICLQTNDYFSNEQHINCCRDLNDAIAKYPMSKTIYTGELETAEYNRFMIIGEK